MVKKRKKALIVEFIFLLLLSGCMGVIDYSISKPAEIGRNYSFRRNGIVVFKIENLELYLQPNNTIASAEGINYLGLINLARPFKNEDHKKENTFYIEILMKAEKEGFLFNPMDVYLELENGKYLPASKYLMPNTKFSSPPVYALCDLLSGARGYDWRMEDTGQIMSRNFKIPTKEWIGFAISFETPTPNPGTTFTIELKGLKYQENHIILPKVKYRDNKITYRLLHQ
jgi:hypothetical protein